MRAPFDKTMIGAVGISGAMLIGTIWLVFDRSFEPPELPRQPVGLNPEGVAKPKRDQVGATLKLFRDRPLFAENRRAATAEEIVAAEVAAAAAAAPPPPPILTGYRLTGTLIGAGKKLAFIQPDDSRDAISLAVGDDVSGWQLVDVEKHQAVFELQTNRTVLSLMPTDKSSSPAAEGVSAPSGTMQSGPTGSSVQNKDRPGKRSPARFYRPPKRQ